MLAADPGRVVSPAAAAAFEALLRRRLGREPVSRILGEREFYGRAFDLGPAALDPRPETETLIDAALRQQWHRPLILDLGTGSGALIITLLAELAGSEGLATDIAPNALEVAARNADRHCVKHRIAFQEADWLDGIDGSFDLIISNPPYIPTAEISGLSLEVSRFDPILALDGGADGLEPYRKLAAGALARLKPAGRVMVEIGAGQADYVGTIFAHHGFAADLRWNDLDSHVRCLGFRSPFQCGKIGVGKQSRVG